MLTISDRIQLPSKTTHKDTGTKVHTCYFNDNHYNFLNFDWCINFFIFHYLFCGVVIGQLVAVSPVSRVPPCPQCPPVSPCVPSVPLCALCLLVSPVSSWSPVSPCVPCVLSVPLCPLVSPVSPLCPCVLCVPLCPFITNCKVCFHTQTIFHMGCSALLYSAHFRVVLYHCMN